MNPTQFIQEGFVEIREHLGRTLLQTLGVILGVLVMLIRAYGVWADAVPFAVVLANTLNPLLDRIRPCVKRLEAAR